MAVTFFTQYGIYPNRGRVICVSQWNPVIKVKFTDWGGFQGLSAIINRISTTEQANYQFLHTLGENIYLYVFGDRIGQLTLSGLTFNDNCSDPNQEKGFSKVIRWYRQHRVTVRQEPLHLTFQPGVDLQGYLVEMRGDTVDPSQRLYQFLLTLALIPEKLATK
jgi:hypothetical protein